MLIKIILISILLALLVNLLYVFVEYEEWKGSTYNNSAALITFDEFKTNYNTNRDLFNLNFSPYYILFNGEKPIKLIMSTYKDYIQLKKFRDTDLQNKNKVEFLKNFNEFKNQ